MQRGQYAATSKTTRHSLSKLALRNWKLVNQALGYATKLPATERKTGVDTPWPHPIATSSKVIEQRSAFLAHASILPRNGEPQRNINELFSHLESLPRFKKELKKATHRMYAYKVEDHMHNGVRTGQNDGGESGAGQFLSKIVQAHRSHSDVAVVVWRWYGGVKLGSKRWRCISEVAREALSQL